MKMNADNDNDEAELNRRFALSPLHLAVVANDIHLLSTLLVDNNSSERVDARHESTGHTALSLAVKLGRREAVQCLLDAGANGEASLVLKTHKTFVETTPCHMAARHVDDSLMAAFIAANVTLSMRDTFGNSLCHIASLNSNENVLARLLAAGAPCNARSAFGLPAHFAAANANDAVLSVLLANGGDCSDIDDSGLTPCHVAAKNRNEKVIALLIAAGVPINETDENCSSPCHVAAQNPNDAVLARLIAAGANVDVVDEQGRTPLVNAASNLNERALAHLIAAGADPNACKLRNDNTLCHVAAANPNALVLAQVIALGVDVNARDDLGTTTCHVAAMSGSAAGVRALLDAGANVTDTTTDKWGLTVCHMAAMHASADTLELLLSRGFSVEVRDPSGRLPIHIAAEHLRLRSLLTLLNAGADINALDKLRRSVIQFAASDHGNGVGWDTRRDDEAVLRLLLRRGANFRTTDALGQSVMHRATATAAALLFARGASVDALDLRGQLPLIVAANASRDPAVLATLIAAGAHVPISDWPTTLCDLEQHALLAAGGAHIAVHIPRERIAAACEHICTRQWVLLRWRAFEVCVGLQALQLPALVTCEILAHAFAPRESLVAFHRVWAIATTVKHF
jgi:ankyrin repeat protein